MTEFSSYTHGTPCWVDVTSPDLEKTIEVEVRFYSEAPERTRVELEHRNLERHGEGWEGLRDAVGSEGGWGSCLQSFAERMATLRQ